MLCSMECLHCMLPWAIVIRYRFAKSSVILVDKIEEKGEENPDSALKLQSREQPPRPSKS